MNYHHLEIKITTNHKAPYYLGSTLRGAFGHALKKVTCINPSYKCEGCFASSSCLYYDFYEKKGGYHNYRFNIELGSNKFDFELYLFNEACSELPYILSALEKSLTEQGLTRANYTFEELEFYLNGELVYRDGEFKSLDTPPKCFKVDNYCPNVKVKLLTPLRIKKSNAFLTKSVEIEDILRSCFQKEQWLEGKKEVYRLNYTPTYDAQAKALSYKELVRKSNRQKQKMQMDGLIGEIALSGLDRRSYELLKLGEITGVGKQVVMGLGRIEVEDL